MTFPTLKHFRKAEFTHPEMMDAACLRWWDRVREMSGVPMVVTSDGRPGDPGLHGQGRAIDFRSRTLSARQKWQLAEAIHALADYAPGKVEFEVVHSPVDEHWHLGIDPRPGAEHEFFEKDD